MTWGDADAKEPMKKENTTSDSQCDRDHSKKNPLISFLEKDTIYNQQIKAQRSTKDMSQTIDLFRKYLRTKAEHTIGKTNVEESEYIKRSKPRALVPPKLGCNLPRHPSFLEQKLLPGVRYEETKPAELDESSKAQLTIFYSGAINVYDNVPVDKARAIMLLAGESTLSNPNATNIVATNLPLSPSRLSSCNVQSDLPVARKHSLKRFLEKRRDRIVDRSPYASSNVKQEVDEPTNDDCMIRNQNSSPSSFPSHLEYLFPISAHNAS